MLVKEITSYLESFAPLSYQESYDNAGLIVGDSAMEVKGILVCLDSTEEIIDEAIASGSNMVVAHHPIIFGGLKKLNGKNYVERAVIKAIKNDIAIYASHTNLDNVKNGVNFKICEKLGLKNVSILEPKNELLRKLVTFIPVEHTEKLLQALHKAGAGTIGDYKSCSFTVEGIGTFEPQKDANPFIGEIGKLESVKENRVEVIFPKEKQALLIKTLHENHPYEVPAYDVMPLSNMHGEVGSGAIGEFENAFDKDSFLAYLKEKMELNQIKFTKNGPSSIKKIAVCGGSGSFLLKKAKQAGADVFITSDMKYHEFFEGENDLLICDIGHYESEVYTKELLAGIILKKFPNFAVVLAKTNTNPVSYF